MKWQDVIIKLVPILPTLLIYWASFSLSHEKQRKETEENREARLNSENQDLLKKLAKERDERFKAQEKVIRLQSKIARLEATVDKLKELLDENEKGKEEK